MIVLRSCSCVLLWKSYGCGVKWKRWSLPSSCVHVSLSGFCTVEMLPNFMSLAAGRTWVCLRQWRAGNKDYRFHQNRLRRIAEMKSTVIVFSFFFYSFIWTNQIQLSVRLFLAPSLHFLHSAMICNKWIKSLHSSGFLSISQLISRLLLDSSVYLILTREFNPAWRENMQFFAFYRNIFVDAVFCQLSESGFAVWIFSGVFWGSSSRWP